MSIYTLSKQQYSFVFFGTPQFGTDVLEELKQRGFVPSLIITAPDKPRGRKLLLTPPPVNIWAKKNNIPVLQPEKLDSDFIRNFQHTIYDIFIVAAYGKIIPKTVLSLPRYGALNVHPSLLPLFRGSSPIQSAILSVDVTGTTIMLMDEELDHGPIVAQEILNIRLPIARLTLETTLARLGGRLLAETIPKLIAGTIEPRKQNHVAANYTKKIKKEDGFVELKDLKKNPEMLYRKFCAYEEWPTLYFFTQKDGKKMRIIVKEATLENGEFVIKKVLPEGGTEIGWNEFQHAFT